MFLFSIFKIMVKARFDRLLKLEFVSQDRLNNEMSVSKEKLTLLMPSHVLEKVNYSEMSSSRFTYLHRQIRIRRCWSRNDSLL